MSQRIPKNHSLDINSFYNCAFYAIILLAITLGLIGLNKGLWNDEIATVIKISHQNLDDMFERLKKDVHPPLYYVLLYFWGKISKQEEFLRLFSLLFSVGTLLVVMKWIKQYSTLGSLIAGLYLATTPIILRYSQELKAYSLVIFATSLAFLFAFHIISNPDKYLGYIGLSLSLTAAVSSHLVGVMVIPAILFFIVIQTFLSNKNIKLLKLGLAIIVPVVTSIYLKFFWLNQVQEIKDTWWWMPTVNLHLISSTTKYLFGFSYLQLSINFIPWFAFIFSAMLATSFLFGEWKISFPFLATALFFWLEILIYSIIDSPIFYYRILLPGLIPFAAFIGLQIATIPKKKIKIASIVCLLLLTISYSVNWISNQAYKPIEQNRAVAQLVESEWQGNGLVIYHPTWIQEFVNYYLTNVPPEQQITAGQLEKISNFDFNSKELNISFIALTGNVKDYSNLLSNILGAIKSKKLTTLKINIFLIKGHDSYFSKKFDDSEKFILNSESKLGKPYFYQDFGQHVISKYTVSLNN
ncbi:MAG: glycosyltransferase family 39 protein [Cyanobacteria bacterium J06633_8]